MSNLCVVCHAQPGPVCPDDQQAIDGQLVSLPRRLAKVAAALMPGQAEPSERVTISKHIHTRPPLNVDGLSLTGPGGDVPPALHPLIRHWSVSRRVAVTALRDGQWRTVHVVMTDWFQEAVIGGDGRPMMVPDDQIGVVPPREWLDQQVRRWRLHFGHHVPARTLLAGRRSYVPSAYRTLLRVPGGTRAIAVLAVLHAATDPGAQARMAYRGLLTADPAVDDLESRGEPRTMLWDIEYLRTWLDKACAEDALDIAAFAAQLHALHGEIDRVLNETADRTWVGRCPAFIAELDSDGEPTGRKRPCGAGLWQENGAFISAQTQCPRCHSTWDTRGHAGAGTAREIRRIWPIDRRRRYKLPEIQRITAPKCPACGQRVKISWRDVTGTRDKERTWQPTATSCPKDCDEAKKVLA